MEIPSNISSLIELNKFIEENGGIYEINSLEIPKDSSLLEIDKWSIGFIDRGYGDRIKQYRGIKVNYE